MMERQDDATARLDAIMLLLVETALMTGKIVRAAEYADQMSDRSKADEAIARFKVKYAGMPHGEWNGQG